MFPLSIQCRSMSLARHISALNPPQREAVEQIDGPLLVLAGAGTGKTRVVTLRIARMLKMGMPATCIIAVTFTNRAAREMMERVKGFVGKKACKGLTVSTFHSFALKLVKQYQDRLGFERGFTIAGDDDRAALVRSVCRDFGLSERQLPHKLARSLIGNWKTNGIRPDSALDAAVDEEEDLAARVYAQFEKEMRSRCTIDFDDMLLLAQDLLNDHPDVLTDCQNTYRYLMVDEYQDTNEIQYGLIRRLAGARRNLCVVGDDDQSIYGWRGARAGNIIEFTRDFRGAKRVILDQNYRSTNAILVASNAVISNNTVRHEKKLWSALGDGDPVVLYRAENEEDELGWLVAEISQQHREGRKWEEFAILFRANAQSAPLEMAMRRSQIPYRIMGTYSLFDRREVKDVLAYLKCLSNPRDDGALFRILNTPPRGIGATTRERMTEFAVKEKLGLLEWMLELFSSDTSVLPKRAREAVSAFCDVMRKVSVAIEDGVARGIEALLEETRYLDFIEMENRGDPLGAEVRKNGVRALVEAAEQFDSQGEGGLEGFLEMLALDSRKDEESEEFGMTLLTVHSAKGLEFPVVCIVGVEEETFPHRNSLGLEDGIDTIDEERRLFYVAMTRARQRLILSSASKRTRFGKEMPRIESRFIAEIGEERLEILDAASEEPVDSATADDFLSQLRNIVGGSESS